MKMRTIIAMLLMCGVALAGDIAAPDGGIVGMTLEQSLAENEASDCEHARQFRSHVVIVPTTYEPDRPARIAVCDAQAVYAGHTKAVAAKAALDAEIDLVRRQVTAAGKRIQEMQVALTVKKRRRGKEFEKMIEEFAETKAKYDLFVEVKESELNAKRVAILEAGIAGVQAAVTEVAKTRGVNLVLVKTERQVLYADDSLDITEAVIEAVNKEVE